MPRTRVKAAYPPKAHLIRRKGVNEENACLGVSPKDPLHSLCYSWNCFVSSTGKQEILRRQRVFPRPLPEGSHSPDKFGDPSRGPAAQMWGGTDIPSDLGLQKAWKVSPNSSSRAAGWTHPENPRVETQISAQSPEASLSGRPKDPSGPQFARVHYGKPFPPHRDCLKGRGRANHRRAGPGTQEGTACGCL